MLASGAGSNSPQQPPASGTAIATGSLAGRLVFSAGDLAGDIFVMSANGTRRVRLTKHPAADFDPAWSPDGRRIAFRSHRDKGDNNEIYVMDAEGRVPRNLTRHPAADYSPAWSPDGRRIAFASDRDDSSGNDIYVIDADGSGLRRVTRRRGIDEYPTWSPDGRRIAFACTGGAVLEQGVGDFEICVADADRRNVVQLTDAPGISQLPDWSPNGSRIVFESDRNGWPTLPDYRPPGYSEDQFGDMEVFVMNADGSDERNLTRNPREDERAPAWRPTAATSSTPATATSTSPGPTAAAPRG